METKAVARYIRVTPRKAGLVVDLIRGKSVAEAIRILKFLPHHATIPVKKLLYSAMANAEQKEVKDVENMIISKAFVDQGPTLKRFMPRAMGRANIIRKRTSHITLFLSEEKE
jgi:large subunit ribosomal protein L22